MADVEVFIGYDSRERGACYVCAQSIYSHNKSLRLKFVNQEVLRSNNFYYRPPDEKASTEFSLTRFLVPSLSAAKYSIFCDGDFVFKDDVSKVLNEIDPEAIVSCVQHDYVPKQKTKMNGETQHVYPKKNWSSFMVFNNEKAKKVLGVDVVNTSTPSFLHQFEWASPSALDKKWNHLVGEYEPNPDAIGIHYTNGGPWHGIHTELDADWTKYKDELLEDEWVDFYYFPEMPLYEMMIPGIELGDPRLDDPHAFDHKLIDWGNRRGYTVFETLQDKGQINPNIGLWENNRWRIEPGQARWLGMHYLGWKTQKVLVAVTAKDKERFEKYKKFDHVKINTKDDLADLFIGDTWDGFTGHGYLKRRFWLFFDFWGK